ncbi:MAG: hypothetical protein MUO54_07870, partial [Anaerolineales bacterium]|nr:hypothetical protein [Anaerolineales bacterium]
MTNIKKSVFYAWKFILLFIPLFFVFVSPVYAVNVTLQWVPNSEPNLAGYRVFSRGEGQSYDYNNPSLEVPEASCNVSNLDENKTYYFVVRAFDTKGFESSDSNEVCLEAATTPNTPAPDVAAGSGQTIILPADTVVLEATCTDDDLPNGTLNSQWNQLSGPANQVVFDNAYDIQTTATFLSAGTYVLQLTADDREFTSSDKVTITVTPPEPTTPNNQPPIAVIAKDYMEAISGTTVTLDGSRSSDADDGIASYHWSQVDGTPVVLSGHNSKVVTFTAPETDQYGSNLTFRLTLTDFGGLQSTADCSVYITPENAPASVILKTHFDNNKGGFSYVDDPFRNTSQPSYADGVW